MAMLGGECSPCCEGGCPCCDWDGNAAKWHIMNNGREAAQIICNVGEGDLVTLGPGRFSDLSWANGPNGRVDLRSIDATIPAWDVYAYTFFYVSLVSDSRFADGSCGPAIATWGDQTNYSTPHPDIPTIIGFRGSVTGNIGQGRFISVPAVIYGPTQFIGQPTTNVVGYLKSVSFGGVTVGDSPGTVVFVPSGFKRSVLTGAGDEVYRINNADWGGPLSVTVTLTHTPLGNPITPTDYTYTLDLPTIFQLPGCGTEGSCDVAGACCETDGTCNIKPQCECDTENGAVFAGVGETCEACSGYTCPATTDWPIEVLVDWVSDLSEIAPGGPSLQCVDAISDYFSQSGTRIPLKSISETGRTTTYELNTVTDLQSPHTDHNHYPGFPSVRYQAGFVAQLVVSCGEQFETPYASFSLQGAQYFGDCDQTIGEDGLSGGIRIWSSGVRNETTLAKINSFVDGTSSFLGSTDSTGSFNFVDSSAWSNAATWAAVSRWPWWPDVGTPGSWFPLRGSANIYLSITQSFVAYVNPLP